MPTVIAPSTSSPPASRLQAGRAGTTAPQDPISSSKKDQSSSAPTISPPATADRTSSVQLEMKAQALVERLMRAKEDIKDYKNALKAYKMTSDKMEELKKARREFTQQLNDEKSRIEADFQKDKTYNELREKVLEAEEKVAVAKQDLKVLLRDKAKEQEFVELVFEVDGQPMKLQTQMKVAIYFNGKEEK